MATDATDLFLLLCGALDAFARKNGRASGRGVHAVSYLLCVKHAESSWEANLIDDRGIMLHGAGLSKSMCWWEDFAWLCAGKGLLEVQETRSDAALSGLKESFRITQEGRAIMEAHYGAHRAKSGTSSIHGDGSAAAATLPMLMLDLPSKMGCWDARGSRNSLVSESRDAWKEGQRQKQKQRKADESARKRAAHEEDLRRGAPATANALKKKRRQSHLEAFIKESKDPAASPAAAPSARQPGKPAAPGAAVVAPAAAVARATPAAAVGKAAGGSMQGTTIHRAAAAKGGSSVEHVRGPNATAASPYTTFYPPVSSNSMGQLQQQSHHHHHQQQQAPQQWQHHQQQQQRIWRGRQEGGQGGLLQQQWGQDNQSINQNARPAMPMAKQT